MPHLLDASLYILSGITFFAGINHISWGLGKATNTPQLLFGVMGLTLSIYSLSYLALLKAEHIDSIVYALKWNLSLASFYFTILPWFVYSLTGIGSKFWLTLGSLFTILLAITNPVFPFSFQYSQIDIISSHSLPWGEQFNVIKGQQYMLFRFAAFVTFLINVYSLYAFFVSHRRTQRMVYLVFTIFITLNVITNLQAILSRLGYGELPPLGVYSYLLMIIIMSIVFNRDSHQRILKSEQRFKSLFEQSPLSILLLTPQGIVLQVNRAFEALWGLKEDQVKGYNLLQDKQLDELGVLPFIRKGLSGQATEIPAINYNPAENPQLKGPHNDKMVRGFIYPVRDESGHIREITLLQEDISNSLRIQQELAQRERDLRSILDNLPSLIGYWDKSLHNRFANRAYEGWYNLSPGQIRGMHVRELLGDELYQKNLPYIERALRGETQQFERTFVLNEGKSVHHGLMHYLPDIVDGAVQGFYVLVTDVTELKNLENRLAKSQAISHAGSWELEIQSGKTWWSEETSRIFGVAADIPITLQFFAERVHADDRDRVLDILKQTTGSAAIPAFSLEHRIVLNDGTVKWVQLSAEVSFDTHKIPYLISAVIQDISVSKHAAETQDQLQKQLLQAHKMESIGQLTGGIAHDFNNMLGAIQGYTQMLRQISDSQLPDAETRKQKYFEEILNAANRAKELIRQMMTFSRGNTEEQAPANPPILLAPILKEVTSLLRSSIPSSISIGLQIADDNLRAAIKPVHLHQIILNLVINARDAVGEYGNISVSMLRYSENSVCSTCKKDFSGTYARISVEDNGSGIPADILEKIFDPFFTTKEVGKGTGMGLSVVHGHVHAIGGHITVNSEPGTGSVINIFLPLSDEKHLDSAKAPSAASQVILHNLPDARIMVVDDEHAIAQLITELLEQNGAKVSTFNQSTTALQAFNQNWHDIDMVITDVTMPEMSGFDMAKQMLQNRPNLPIILCTGFNEKVDRNIALASGMADFFYKPLDIAKLTNRVNDLLKKTPQDRK